LQASLQPRSILVEAAAFDVVFIMAVDVVVSNTVVVVDVVVSIVNVDVVSTADVGT